MSTLQSSLNALTVLLFQVITFDMDSNLCDCTTGSYHDIIYIICTHFSINVCKRLWYCAKVSIQWIPKMIPSWPFILDGLTMPVAPFPSSVPSHSLTLTHVEDAERVVSRLSPAYLSANRSKAVSVTRRRNLKVSTGITDELPSSPWTYS